MPKTTVVMTAYTSDPEFTFGIYVSYFKHLKRASIDLRCTAIRHNVKSIAGTIFRADTVRSVCVYDPNGVAHLYLRKDADGTVHREEAE